MPHAHNQGVAIHYETEGHGPPLVLQHGFTSSLEHWRAYGYVQALKDDYSLILVDARGHGRSEKPHDPGAYTRERMAGDVTAVLDDLGIAKAMYWGYSMGGWIGFDLAKHASQRFSSFIIGGMHPYQRDPIASDQMIADMRKAVSGGMEAYVAAMEQRNGAILAPIRAMRLQNDAEALLAAAIAFRNHASVEGVLPTMTVPCLLYAGEADALYPGSKQCATRLPNPTFFSLPGLNHAQAIARSDLVLPHATKFLKAVSQVAAAR